MHQAHPSAIHSLRTLACPSPVFRRSISTYRSHGASLEWSQMPYPTSLVPSPRIGACLLRLLVRPPLSRKTTEVFGGCATARVRSCWYGAFARALPFMKDNAAGEAAMPHLAAVYEKRLTPTVQGACGCLRSNLLHKPRWTTDVNSLLRRHDVIIL